MHRLKKRDGFLKVGTGDCVYRPPPRQHALHGHRANHPRSDPRSAINDLHAGIIELCAVEIIT